MKLLGSLLLLFAGIGTAIHLIRLEQKKCTVLEGWIRLIRRIRSQIDCYLTPLDEILAALEPELSASCGAIHGSYESLDELFRVSSPYLSADARRELPDFVREIGSGYREEQLKVCDLHLLMLCNLQEKLRKELPSAIRVRAVLCIGAALALCILLW